MRKKAQRLPNDLAVVSATNWAKGCLVLMAVRTLALLWFAVVALCACDGKTAAENHREAAGQQTMGGLKEGVGGLIGDKSLKNSGEAQSDQGRTNEKIANFKDAVHKAFN